MKYRTHRRPAQECCHEYLRRVHSQADRHRFACDLGVTLVGLVAFRQLPISALPTVDSPTILVTAQLPGADPQTMASSVATPLERQFGRIAGLTQMSVEQRTGQYAGHAAVCVEPGRGCGCARCADGDQCRGRTATEDDAFAAHLSEGESGGRARAAHRADVRYHSPDQSGRLRRRRELSRRSCRRYRASRWSRSEGRRSPPSGCR